MDDLIKLIFVVLVFGGTGSVVAIIEAIRGNRRTAIPPPTVRDAEAAWLFQKVLLQDSQIPCLTEETKKEVDAFLARYMMQLKAATEAQDAGNEINDGEPGPDDPFGC